MSSPERVTYPFRGRRLATWQWPGVGPPLVMLPGAGGNGRLFADLVDALPRRRVIAVDPPGVGESDHPGTDRDARDLGRVVDGLAALARGAFDPPAIWVGHSWGGKVSAMLAGRHPELAAATILVDPSPAGALPMDDDALGEFAASIWDGRGGPWPTEDAAIDALRGRRHYERWTPNVEASLRGNLVKTETGAVTVRSSLDDMLAESDATLRVDRAAAVAAIECPTLYLVASESRWWQALSNDHVVAAHAERVDVEGQHLLYIDQPTKVATTITEFLTSRGL